MASEIFKQIERDWQLSQQYLLSGEKDETTYSAAAAIVYAESGKKDRALIDARRKVASEGLSVRWVIKTQLKFAIYAEKSLGYICWETESQIKRHWKRLVQLTSEVAARLPKSQKKSKKKKCPTSAAG